MIVPIIQAISSVIDKIVPDTAARDKAKAELTKMQINGDLEAVQKAAGIIIAEAQGHSWLQRNWRPLTMVTFVGLIVAKWLGFTAPGISEALEMELFAIIKIGIGGYVLGRSAEKGIKEWKK